MGELAFGLLCADDRFEVVPCDDLRDSDQVIAKMVMMVQGGEQETMNYLIAKRAAPKVH